MGDRKLSEESERLLEEIRSLVRPAPKPSLLTQNMAATELSISVSKLRNFIRQGLIAAVRIGGKGHPMIARSEIERLIADWTERAKNAPRPPRRRKKEEPYNAASEAAKTRARIKANRRRS